MKEGLKIIWALGWRVSLLLLIWQLVIKLVIKHPARFAESNLVSNQIRIQDLALRGQGGIVLVGSSMIARLDAEVISKNAGGVPVVQLGLDGGRMGLGLSVIGSLDKKPDVLILEANSFSMELSDNDQILLEQADEPVFQIAQYFPPVRAANRPSAILYSDLKEWKDERRWSAPITSLSANPLGFKNDQPLHSPEQEGITKASDLVVEQVSRLGVPWDRVLIVMLPNGDRANERDYLISAELKKRTCVQILDLKGHAESGEYLFTDGLHLDLQSGIKASTRLGMALSDLYSKKTRVD